MVPDTLILTAESEAQQTRREGQAKKRRRARTRRSTMTPNPFDLSDPDGGLQWNTSLNSSSIAAQDFLSASALYSRASIPALPASGLVNPCLTPG